VSQIGHKAGLGQDMKPETGKPASVDVRAMLGSRRHFLLICSGALALLPGRGWAAVPWSEKKPTEWSPADMDYILNRSGWTRQASPEFTPTAIVTGDAKKEGSVEGLRDKRTLTEFKVLVRWESALPLRQARARRNPHQTDDGTHYRLSMSRFPIELMTALSGGAPRGGKSQPPDRTEIAAQIAQRSSIERDGKPVLHADQAYWLESDFESRIMISFPKGSQPIEPTERQVTFVGQVGDLIVRAPFFLKEMVYRGNLEL
jgi:hypothetical protein